MKHILVILMLGISLTMNAQDGFKFGGGLSYEKNVGLQLKTTKGLTDNLNGELSGTYFFVNGYTLWGFDSNIQYKALDINDSVTIRPLAGLNFAYSKVKATETTNSTNSTDIGINLGVEAAFPISGFNVYVQPKYVINGIGGYAVSAGLYF